MVKALARAFRWRKMLDTGVHATVDDLARAKGVAPSYVSRILRLTLLSPGIVEADRPWPRPRGVPAVHRHGAKVLTKAIRRTFGTDTPIQRCQVHKARNITDRIEPKLYAAVRRALRQDLGTGRRRAAQSGVAPGA